MRTKAAFLVALSLMILMALPLAAMPFRVDAGDEYREMREFPKFRFSAQFATEFEGWFSDHFGFREPLVRLNAWVRVVMLGTSPSEDVIVGEGGMLFFAEELPDYQDSQPLTPEELSAIREHVALMADALSERGARLFLAVAPNKSSVYPERMPKAYPHREGEGNLSRLRDALSGVDNLTQVDLLAALMKDPRDTYFKTDTHWSDIGAERVAHAILSAMDNDGPVTDPGGSQEFSGDLARMVGLKDILRESYTRLAPEDGNDYSQHLLSVSGAGEGSLLLLRDSFGTILAPFVTPLFEETQLRWQTPLQISGSPDDALILIAERNIRMYLLDEPPQIIDPDEDSTEDEDYEELLRMRAEMRQEEEG